MKMFRVVVNGSEYKVGIEELAEENTTPPDQPEPLTPASRPVPANTEAVRTVPEQQAGAGNDSDNAAGTVIAPMPGTVIAVEVTEGETVAQGQTLLILEAMKMENNIMATCAGTVQEIKTNKGASVNAGDILVVMTS